MKVITPLNWSRSLNLEVIPKSKSKLRITTQSGNHILLKQDISCLHASGNYTTISVQGKKILCSQTMNTILQKINMPNFIRIHKSYVVNLDFIKHIDSAFSTITIDDGQKLIVSRARKKEIKQIILSRFD